MAVEYGAHGRWQGKLTRRALPLDDASIDELAPAHRRKLAGIWLNRAAMERRVADSFEVIRDALVRRGAKASLVELAVRAIDDEYRHAELSRVVASRFAGVELEPPPRLLLEVPKHAGASPELRDTLFVVGQCLLNETTAGAFLEACLEHAQGQLARAALQELLSDEIDHGRIGWAELAAEAPRMREQVGRWLLPMAYLNLQLWRKETPYDPEHDPVLSLHGAPPAGVIHAALVDALTSLIVPGLKQLAIDTRALETWLAAGADTERPPLELLGH
jgi:hypothetical protein